MTSDDTIGSVASLAALLQQCDLEHEDYYPDLFERWAEWLLARGVQYAPREPSHWTLGTLAAEMGRAIRHEVPPGAIQADATELIALTCANVALRGAAQGLGEPPDPDDDAIAARLATRLSMRGQHNDGDDVLPGSRD